MGNINFETGRKVNTTILTVLLLAVAFLAFVTFDNRHVTSQNSFLAFAARNHMWIMVVLMVMSVLFGFYTSKVLYSEIQRRTKASKSILDLVMLFLGEDEKSIINFLVEKNGQTSQAEISRLHNMNRVKAHRSLQKLQDKKLIIITPHGKVRYIKLKDNILDLLLE